MSVPAPRAGGILEDVLSYCLDHPYQGSTLVVDDLLLQNTGNDNGGRTVTVMGNAPEIVSFGTEVLDLLEPGWPGITSFRSDGVLVLDVQPEPLLYRPLYVGRGAREVVFRRVT